MGHCKDCQYWAKRSTHDAKEWGICARIQDEATQNDYAYIKDGAYAETTGELMTSGDFGCVLFEAKEFFL